MQEVTVNVSSKYEIINRHALNTKPKFYWKITEPFIVSEVSHAHCNQFVVIKWSQLLLMLFTTLLPPANEVGGKLVFSQGCVILSTGGGGWFPSIHHMSRRGYIQGICIWGGLNPGGDVCIRGGGGMSASGGGGGGRKKIVHIRMALQSI